MFYVQNDTLMPAAGEKMRSSMLNQPSAHVFRHL
jgi:hypothetical protein